MAKRKSAKDEVKVTIKTEVELPMDGNRLRECKECMHSIDGCTYCTLLQKHIFPYQYACFKFKTREQEIAELTAKKKELADKMERKLNFLLTAMVNCSTATEMLFEDFDSRFAGLKGEDEWRHSRKMAYKKIREHIEGARKLYTQYLHKDLDNLFTDRGKKEYDVVLYDNHQMDAMETCRLMLLYLDRCWDDEKVANEIVGFIESKPSLGIFESEDIEHYRLRR